MKKMRLSLSSVLLAALIIPVVMTYQIFPGDTNFIQFGLIFLCLFLTFVLDAITISEKKYYLYKYTLFWTILALAVGGAFISAIMVRHKVAPVFQIHDIILQLEAAIRFFLDGINPWAATYHNTFMAEWNYSQTAENPALYHFVMMPFYLIFSLPFYYIANHTIGYFDGRIPMYMLYLSLLIMAFRIVKDKEQKIIFTTLLALSPAMFSYTLEGRSDVFMFAFMFGGMILLGKRKFLLSGILMALAFTVKQSIWPILPLYFSYIYFVSNTITLTFKRLSTFIVTFLIFTLPFFLWNPDAFLNSTVFYLSGNTVHSYPISGYGLGSLLHQIGVIKDLNASYPFIFWQVLIITPLLIFTITYLKKHTNVRTLLFTYGILAFAYWYMSRYFNNSHMGYLTMVFLTAYFWPDNENKEPATK
ncbi:MAG: glycosyltransferase 87 family protein [Candidatus Levybacteria bacterium]|nr:glycosyltransferase 87 family protein [Candidatus Levybacteria bacterium]